MHTVRPTLRFHLILLTLLFSLLLGVGSQVAHADGTRWSGETYDWSGDAFQPGEYDWSGD